ncbi:MAG: endonuclease/exonuclease/phosphatase family protein [Planctomycetota bacterium]|jgi:endonuclease/exonuclease/phosphatase (EEP) superfamily protein YafD
MVLFVGILICYLFKPDTCAALTFFPVWAWGLSGVIFSVGSLLYKKRIYITLVLCWFIFILIFAEEPWSLLRGLYISSSKWESIPENKKITVISLNCAGGNIEAVRETLPYDPDIVLLQEVPSGKEDIVSVLRATLESDVDIAYGPDTAIIVRGELEEISLSKPKNIFMTQARVYLDSGHEIEVICTRLKPPVIDINILSRNCWVNHRKDRESKRKQIVQIVEQINSISDEVPVILGGDFNVTAGDGSLRALSPFLSDTFAKGGIGWGHTALNSIPLFRVDQIWASSDFKPISVFARKTKHSDHRMVISYLEVE